MTSRPPTRLTRPGGMPITRLNATANAARRALLSAMPQTRNQVDTSVSHRLSGVLRVRSECGMVSLVLVGREAELDWIDAIEVARQGSRQ